MKRKCDLVHTHTARRTGATLMYLSGMDIYDIMKITGHSTPQTLKKYIKADKLEVMEKIVDKYDYFN
jgi:integrase